MVEGRDEVVMVKELVVTWLPAPVSETVFGEDGALLVTVSVPEIVPAAVGVRLSSTCVVPPGANVAGSDGLETMAKELGLAVIAESDRAAAPVFFRVTT